MTESVEPDRRTWAFMACIIAGGIAVVCWLFRAEAPTPVAAKTREQQQEEVWAKSAEDGKAREAEARIREAEAKAAQDAIDNKETERLKKLGAAGRLKEAKAVVANCINNNVCDGKDIAGFMPAAADDKEQTVIGALVGAELAAMAAKHAKDGTKLSADVIVKAAGVLGSNGKMGLRHLPTTTRGAAMKDPESQRGKVISASGSVIQIHKDGPVFVGTLMTDGLKAIYFVTPFETGQIVEGSYASFRGIFAQEYDYPNVSGGETQSVALVGAFD